MERTKAGVARAKERGVRFGRERQIDLAKAEKLIRSGKTIAQVASACGVSKPTVYNWFSGTKLAALRRSGPKRKR